MLTLEHQPETADPLESPPERSAEESAPLPWTMDRLDDELDRIRRAVIARRIGATTERQAVDEERREGSIYSNSYFPSKDPEYLAYRAELDAAEEEFLLANGLMDEDGHWPNFAEPQAPAPAEPEVDPEDLFVLARAGGAEVVPALEAALARDPALADRLVGSLSERVESLLLPHLVGPDPVLLAAGRVKLESMRKELVAEGDGGALDRLLVGGVMTTWLMVRIDEAVQASLLGTDADETGKGKVVRERLAKDHARHLKAVKTLAATRSLLR
jgi:hypothetical protein